MPIATDHIRQLEGMPGFTIQDEAFAKEHSLEVQLPFLQHQLESFTVLPILVGHTTIEAIHECLDTFYDDSNALLVISSDLSHGLNYAEANQLDLITSEQIQKLETQQIRDHQACGRYPVKGLLALARNKGLTVRITDLRNSGDTQSNLERVVGYGAYHAYVPDENLGFYSLQQKKYLKNLAKVVIQEGARIGSFQCPDLSQAPFRHCLKKATFVTLKKQDRLCGCIGSLIPHQNFLEDLATNAYKAAFKDPRFNPLTTEELRETRLSISILSDPVPITVHSEHDLIQKLCRGIDGLIIEDQNKRAVFLASVWQSIPDPKTFLRQLKVKATLAPDHWSDTFKAYRFITDIV